jgi:hypothetical protein
LSELSLPPAKAGAIAAVTPSKTAEQYNQKQPNAGVAQRKMIIRGVACTGVTAKRKFVPALFRQQK